MIERLYLLMAKVGIDKHQDKVLHVIGGFIAGVVATLVCGDAVGFLAGFAVALGIELHDKFNDGVVDYFDMFFTLVAATVGVMLIGGVLSVSPLYTVSMHELVFIGILAVYGVGVWYLFVDKD